jgi:CRISPR-associated protein Cas5d
MRWIVDRILMVRHPRAPSGTPPALPSTLALRRNELQSVVAPSTVSGWIKKPDTYQPQAAGAGEGTDATPRVTIALKNVAYVIEAHAHVFAENGGENTPQKYVAMFERRVAKGQCRHQPYLGCREFAAEFRLATAEDLPLNVTVDLGRMLYDVVFAGKAGNRPVFFAARLERGALDTRPEVVLHDEAARVEVLACSYRR